MPTTHHRASDEISARSRNPSLACARCRAKKKLNSDTRAGSTHPPDGIWKRIRRSLRLARRGRGLIVMAMHAVRQPALGAQSFHLARYCRTRTTRRDRNFSFGVIWPLGNKLAEFLPVQRIAHLGYGRAKVNRRRSLEFYAFLWSVFGEAGWIEFRTLAHESFWPTRLVTAPSTVSCFSCTPHADARGQWRCRSSGRRHHGRLPGRS